MFSSPYRRAAILASATILGTTWLGAAMATPMATVQDLGLVAADTAITATVWLKPHDPAALDAAVSERTTPGSALYHRWMTPADVARMGATAADLQVLTSALQATGLAIVSRADDGGSIQVRGTAATMQAALRTSLHEFSRGTQRFHAPVTTPTVAGPAGVLVAGVTGLTSAGMVPFIARQMDATGNPVVQSTIRPGDTGPVNLARLFTNDCFHDNYHFVFGRFRPGVGGTTDKMVGPHYIGTGFGRTHQACGYTAAQVRQHYGMSSLYASGLKGDGKTIVIVDAYGSPSIQQDANLFSKEMGLPALNDANFQVIYPAGPPTTSPYPTGWPGEVSLDVEWAHAMAPGAKIVLVIAPTADDTQLAQAVQYAVRNNLGDIITNSYGEPEAAVGPAVATAYNTVFRQAAAQGIAVFVSTGDSGDFGVGSPVGAASIPADSPYATGVGGTSLGVPSDTGPVDSVWGITATFLANQNEVANPPVQDGFLQGGGGGQSAYLPKPAWQKALPGVGRQLPDVSAMADPFTGAILFAPTDDGWNTAIEAIGGTSLSSPLMAGLWAVAEQAAGARLGNAAPIIATMPAGSLTDIKPVIASAYYKNNLSGTVSTSAGDITYYGPADLLGLTAIQPTGFVGTLARFSGSQYSGVVFVDLGFGADSSLIASPGWDNATGYGSPNGPAFVAAAAAAAAK